MKKIVHSHFLIANGIKVTPLHHNESILYMILLPINYS